MKLLLTREAVCFQVPLWKPKLLKVKKNPYVRSVTPQKCKTCLQHGLIRQFVTHVAETVTHTHIVAARWSSVTTESVTSLCQTLPFVRYTKKQAWRESEDTAAFSLVGLVPDKKQWITGPKSIYISVYLWYTEYINSIFCMPLRYKMDSFEADRDLIITTTTHSDMSAFILNSDLYSGVTSYYNWLLTPEDQHLTTIFQVDICRFQILLFLSLGSI